MSLHYYDAGSGPHDAESRVNDRGECNCSCRHDGHAWVAMCATARTAHDELHNTAAFDCGAGANRED
jgi:hypothetical protein